ncbi:MAG: LLM class flavin-dependent oxidoreductase [Alphaproteobacteria bacterium]|nr:LLM class flavin-dependent oxidoreductase [Alphaproteobacteria bacterium]
MLRFANFIFPEAKDPSRDAEYIAEALEEARLTERLGFDSVWLAEHHFDGNCAYVDPVTFAGAVLGATKTLKVGFAVAQVSLYHPIRLAEQMSLLDNLGRGRLIVGVGRGTAYNVYEYQGYGIPHTEASARYEEAEEIMIKAWTGETGFAHEGKFWQVKGPTLRPRPFTRPHPFVLRAASSDHGTAGLAKRGLPFMMNVQSDENTLARLTTYKAAMREAGHSEAHLTRSLEQCWVWRNVYVGETDAEAERVGLPYFLGMVDHRSSMRERVSSEQGQSITNKNPVYRDPKVGLLAGSPATVAERMAKIARMGPGGVMMQFRLGSMPAEVAAASMKRFAEQVMPEFNRRMAAAAE